MIDLLGVTVLSSFIAGALWGWSHEVFSTNLGVTGECLIDVFKVARIG